MVGVGQNDNVDASAGTGTAISINYNNASALFGSGYDDGQTQQTVGDPNDKLFFISCFILLI